MSPCTPVFSTNKTDRHDITEILLKMGLSTINQTKPSYDDGGIRLGYVVHPWFLVGFVLLEL
jgi:hypothetical protein